MLDYWNPQCVMVAANPQRIINQLSTIIYQVYSLKSPYVNGEIPIEGTEHTIIYQKLCLLKDIPPSVLP